MKNTSKQMIGAGLLLMAALIWGSTFVAQDLGMQYIGPFTFNGVRCLVGCIALSPIIIYNKNKYRQNYKENQNISASKKLIIQAGLVCGFILCTASMLQQIGIQYTTVGKAGFLTALYMVFVPILRLISGKKAGMLLWVSVSLALIGAYLLSVNEGVKISFGDILMLCSALFFAFHILAVDRFSPKMSAIQLSFLQLLVNGVISLIAAFIFELPNIAMILKAWFPIIFTGILSSGIAYTFQMIGQRYVNPVAAPIIMSMESVFAVISGWLILHQPLSFKEIIGCVLVFIAAILAQFSGFKQEENMEIKQAE